ncbi:MAG: ABC transporter permease [Anaerolineales bacterium]|nr:ABC transporter permease [Anaerolineales bacterium]
MSNSVVISRARLVWAIVAKDFVDSLKNRKLLTNIFTVVFLVLLYRFLPVLGNADRPARVILYDAGQSPVSRELQKSEALRLRSVESYEEMLREVGIEDVRTIGLVLPTDFDQQIRAHEGIVLEAIIDHWVNVEDEVSMKSEVETELSRITDEPIELRVGRERITQADGAHAFSIALGLLIVMGLMAMLYTPQLILEEKEARTIDALQVSPATMTETLIAKGLVGGAYSIIAAIVVLIAYGQFVLHWWAMLVALFAGAFFYVSLGLLMGILLKEVKQVSLWGFIAFQPLIISMILGMFEPIPGAIKDVLRWTPTVAMGNAAAQSITASVDLGVYFLSLLIMIVWGAFFFGLDAWLVRRQER